ncbi:MAG: hypothetical protein KJ067_18165 [Vicinamibacteria bacterium]|nr:hypothetical protein [Vicinamibacteria bacterium]
MKKAARALLLIALGAWTGTPLAAAGPGDSHDLDSRTERGAFVAYELTEMAMNGFRNFAGEVGFRFGPRSQVRLSVMEVRVSERDLAGWWSAAVDGPGVEGYLRAYEVEADRFFKGNWYAGLNAGFVANRFSHVRLPERLSHRTATAGVTLGYSRAGLFGWRRLHLDVAMPMRLYLDGIAETRLGDATVRAHKIVPNTWVFVGYRF